MEIKVNIGILCTLAIVWLGLVSTEPTPTSAMDNSQRADLAALEDEVATDPSARATAALAAEYLAAERPGLAIATVRSASVPLTDSPQLTHTLARAYEMSGRVGDAFATAELALDRCGRALGARGAAARPITNATCSASEFAQLDMHRNALRHLAAWGVIHPPSDSRTTTAYNLAMRRASVALVQ